MHSTLQSEAFALQREKPEFSTQKLFHPPSTTIAEERALSKETERNNVKMNDCSALKSTARARLNPSLCWHLEPRLFLLNHDDSIPDIAWRTVDDDE